MTNENETNESAEGTSAPTPATSETTASETVAAQDTGSSEAEVPTPAGETGNTAPTVEETAMVTVTFKGSVTGNATVPKGSTLEAAAKAAGLETKGNTFRSDGGSSLTLKAPLNADTVISAVTKTTMG